MVAERVVHGAVCLWRTAAESNARKSVPDIGAGSGFCKKGASSTHHLGFPFCRMSHIGDVGHLQLCQMLSRGLALIVDAGLRSIRKNFCVSTAHVLVVQTGGA